MLDQNALNAIDSEILDAFEETNDYLYNAIYDAFEAPVYDWDGTVTFRKNRQIVDSPRDIDDTGELKNSQELPEITTSGSEIIAEHRNTADHAHDVYFGYITDSGNEKPGRDWISEALDNVDLEATMAEELRKRI